MLGSRVKSEYMKLKEWLKDENDSPEPSNWANLDWMVPVLTVGGSRTLLTAAALLVFFNYSL